MRPDERLELEHVEYLHERTRATEARGVMYAGLAGAQLVPETLVMLAAAEGRALGRIFRQREIRHDEDAARFVTLRQMARELDARIALTQRAHQ